MKKGEHIYVYFRYKDFKYTHHGIYIGDKKVIHYWKNKIRCTSLDKFRCRKKIHIEKYKQCHTAEVVVKRAKKRLKEKKYNLVLNNCEHFAYYCKTGKHKSEQVEEIPKRVVYEIDKALKGNRKKVEKELIKGKSKSESNRKKVEKQLIKTKTTIDKRIKPAKRKLKKIINRKSKILKFRF
ncbi:MAG: lecithin retinol acyltransferase family protein [Rivularia sp. (in: cyanobacteria)]